MKHKTHPLQLRRHKWAMPAMQLQNPNSLIQRGTHFCNPRLGSTKIPGFSHPSICKWNPFSQLSAPGSISIGGCTLIRPENLRSFWQCLRRNQRRKIFGGPVALEHRRLVVTLWTVLRLHAVEALFGEPSTIASCAFLRGSTGLEGSIRGLQICRVSYLNCIQGKLSPASFRLHLNQKMAVMICPAPGPRLERKALDSAHRLSSTLAVWRISKGTRDT